MWLFLKVSNFCFLSRAADRFRVILKGEQPDYIHASFAHVSYDVVHPHYKWTKYNSAHILLTDKGKDSIRWPNHRKWTANPFEMHV